jgi:hypothetical protein
MRNDVLWLMPHNFRPASVQKTVDRYTAIKEALDTVTVTDIRGWFAHCGYPVH